MAILAYNQLNTLATWTDNGASFASLPPIQNMGTLQVPAPHAEFEGETADFTVATAAAFPLRVLGLIAHTLAEGALIEWLRADGSLIAASVWRAFGSRKANSITLLPAEESISSIRCRISNAGTGTHRIGAAFAGKGWVFRSERGWSDRQLDYSRATRINTTDWLTRRGRSRSQQVVLPLMSYQDALGIELAGQPVSVPTSWATDNSSTESGGVYTFSSAAAGTLLAETGLLSGGQSYRVRVNLTQTAGNSGVVTVAIGGADDQALQPGENALIATASGTGLSIDAQGTFSGDIEVLSIELLGQIANGEDAQSRLDEIGTTTPVIYIPRTDSQQWIQSTARYGRLDGTAQISHNRATWHTVEFNVLEMG